MEKMENLEEIKVGEKIYSLEDGNKLPLYRDGKKVEITEELREEIDDSPFTLSYSDDYIFSFDKLKFIDCINKYSSLDYLDGEINIYFDEKSKLYIIADGEGEYNVAYSLSSEIESQEIFYQGSDELKKIYFGDKLQGINSIISLQEDDEDDETIIINKSFELPDGEPCYRFVEIGINEKDWKDEKDELYLISHNNVNVKESDVPVGQPLTTKEALEVVRGYGNEELMAWFTLWLKNLQGDKK